MVKADGYLASETPVELYQYLLKDGKIDQFVENIPLFKASLGLSEYAPAVQAHYKFYSSINASDKPEITDFSNWIEWGGETLFTSKLPAIGEWKQPEFWPIDHPYCLSERNYTAILYADLYSDDFMSFYNALKAKTAEENFNFVLRYKPSKQASESYLSGYGVELAVKNTEYNAVDDSLNASSSSEAEKQSDPRLGDLQETVPQIKKLSKQEITDIGLKAIAYAAEQKGSFAAVTAISESFPKVAHLLAANQLLSDFKSQHRKLYNSISSYENSFYLNGIPIKDSTSAYDLLDSMKSEVAMFNAFQNLGVSFETASKIIKPLQTKHVLPWGDCYDARSDLVLWLNDLESERYSNFPTSLEQALYSTGPNQFMFIRKNLFSVVTFIDFQNELSVQELRRIFQILRQSIPMRFGVLPRIPDGVVDKESADFYLVHAMQSILLNYPEKASDFMLEIAFGDFTVDFVKSTFAQITESKLEAIADYSDHKVLTTLQELYKRLEIPQAGALFANGKYIACDNHWPEKLSAVYFQMIQHIGRKFMKKEVNDTTDFYEFFMTMPNVSSDRNTLLFPPQGDPITTINFNTLDGLDVVLEEAEWIHPKNNEDVIKASVFLLADFWSKEGLEFALNALLGLKELGIRVLLVDLNEYSEDDDLKIQPELSFDYLIATIEKQLSAKEYKLAIKGSINAKLLSFLGLKQAHKSDEFGIIVNGRFIGPLTTIPAPALFTKLVQFEQTERIDPVADLIQTDSSDWRASSDQIFKVSSFATSLLSQDTGTKQKRQDISKMMSKFENSKFHFTQGDQSNSLLHFTAIIEPISPKGQKIISFLDKVGKMDGVYVQVYTFASLEETETLPLNRFYQFKFDSEPRFNQEGQLAQSSITFTSVPSKSLLTLGMDVPGAWLVRAHECLYDLDNINLSKVGNSNHVEAVFKLQSILVQGHASEEETGAPPRGLQFVLGSREHSALVDTITMANLGYFQLKSEPGLWFLDIREGRSSEVYELVQINENQPRNVVLVDSFKGITLFPIVKRRPGMEQADVYKEPQHQGSWNQVKNMVKNILTPSKKETINVFSVASGHLYERFLAIMMLSVKRQTSNPVKFWLIENFLSPSFIKLLPTLAETFGYEYELVTYKWPEWLRKQTEKQRIIWGYKILFLDVLFPLSLDKVIFVDADQVVRADLDELVKMDLKGAVYGYTPFCDSRKEMDGFRFWNSGYWKSHLGARAYHISALYVVDLVQFRAVAAGDRLRQQYHMLSADPHSLANLDQDLPNNMIHEIPMYSLPQDWLWCETWCSDESLKTAKTIDLCNNPLTKEPKLERAKRILPEWEGLDKEIRKVKEKVGLSKEKPEAHSEL